MKRCEPSAVLCGLYLGIISCRADDVGSASQISMDTKGADAGQTSPRSNQVADAAAGCEVELRGVCASPFGDAIVVGDLRLRGSELYAAGWNSLLRISKADGSRDILAEVERLGPRLAVDDEHVYFSVSSVSEENNAGLGRFSLVDGSLETLLAGLPETPKFAVTETSVFVGHRLVSENGSPGGLHEFWKSNGISEPPVELLGMVSVWWLEADNRALVWSEYLEGTQHLFQYDPAGSEPPRTLASDTGTVEFKLSETHAYWHNGLGLFRVARSGGEPELVAGTLEPSAVQRSRPIAITGDVIYTFFDERLVRVTPGSGEVEGAEVEELGVARVLWIESMIADEAHLYFAVSGGRLYRVAL